MRRYIYILIFLLASSLPVRAQYDYLSVEAYIHDHKVHQGLLLARATLEAANESLHESSMNQTVKYENIGEELDKLSRAFDVIELLYQTLKTSINVYSTVSDVSSCVDDYQHLLLDFNNKILARGYVSLKDTMVIAIGYRACENIYEDSKQLYNSVYDLILYCTGAAACTVRQLVSMLEDIDHSLDLIAYHLRQSYLQMYKYIQIRIGYWKESVNTVQSKKEIATEAFSRWRNASMGNTTKDSNPSFSGDIVWKGDIVIGELKE